LTRRINKRVVRLTEASFEEQWQAGVREVSRRFALLGEDTRQRLTALARELTAKKGELDALSAPAEPAAHCAACGGACCVAGKYHFTKADLLVYLAMDQPLFTPSFDNGLCPYLSAAACLMAPGYRPFNCITFNCERIEDRLPAASVERFYRLERELRRGYDGIKALFPDASLDGALL